MDLFENKYTGRFDSSNFGLWLNLDYALQHPLSQEITPLILTTFHYPINQSHKDYISSITNNENISFAINCFSMFCHEMRHFHDLLISPYGSMLMRQYTRSAVLSLACRADLSLNAKKIVIPLSDWVSNSSIFQKGFSIEPPSSNLIHLNEVFTTMKQKFEVFNDGIIPLRPPFENLDATSILEGLAILNQELFIEKEFGINMVKNFRSSFKSPSAISKYYGALNFIKSVLNENISFEAMSYLLFVSLCGNFQDSDQNHVRYPKDILVEMLAWIKNKNIRLSGIKDFDEIVFIIDDFFDEKLGNDVQGMITQAAKANEDFESTILRDIKSFENAPWGAYDLMKQVLDVYNNFRLVQASFSANVVINPQWYFSEIYLENQHKLPTPVLFLETQIGIPIDESLEKIYYIQTESRMQLDNLPVEIKQSVGNLADKEGIIRAAHILSPRRLDFIEKDLDKRINWWFNVPEIDVDLWQKSYDNVGTEIRCLIEGESSLMNKQLFDVFVFSKSILGTEVYSSLGKCICPDLPDDLSSPLIEPYLRELLSDEKFRSFIIKLREQKKN